MMPAPPRRGNPQITFKRVCVFDTCGFHIKCLSQRLILRKDVVWDFIKLFPENFVDSH